MQKTLPRSCNYYKVTTDEPAIRRDRKAVNHALGVWGRVMRKVFSELDYLTTEIGTVLNLCEWIDRQENAELSEALPTLHVVMHENFNLLVDRFHALRNR